MPTRPLATAVALLSLACVACEGDDAGPGPAAEICPLEAPTLLVPAPAGWQYVPGRTGVSLWTEGDRLLHAFNDDQAQGAVHGVPLCGGETELLVPARINYSHLRYVARDDGLLLYGIGVDGVLVLIDRLDVPGQDAPKPVAGIPPLPIRTVDVHVGFGPSGPSEGGVIYEVLKITPGIRLQAAGIGASTTAFWYHAGDPERPAVALGEAIVRREFFDDAFLVHDDDGAVRRVDPETGASEPVLSGARYVRSVQRPDGSRALIWQAIGDDRAEPVFVRDLATGAEHGLTINDFAADSWNRDPYQSNAGAWLADSDDASAVIALRGSRGVLVRAYDVDTFAAFEIPAHVGTRGVGGDGLNFGLVLEDGPVQVLALWEPRTGAVREWYRGPPGVMSSTRVGDRIEYQQFNADQSVRLMSVDLNTGVTTTVLPRMSLTSRTLTDGRILTRFDKARRAQVVLIDRETGVHKTLVDSTPAWTFLEDFGVIYYDPDAPTPGIWALPIPPR